MLYGLQFGWSPKYHWGGFDGELSGTWLPGKDSFLMDSVVDAALLLGYAFVMGKHIVFELDGALVFGQRMIDTGIKDRYQRYTHISGGGAARLVFVLENGNGIFLKGQYTILLHSNSSNIQYFDDENQIQDLSFARNKDIAITLGYSFYL